MARSCASFILLSLAFSAQAGAVTFSDGDFFAGAWEYQTFVDAGDDGFLDPFTGGSFGLVTFLQFRWQTHSHQIVDDDTVITVALNVASVYDPSQQGAIGSLDLSIDVGHCCVGGTTGLYLIMEQDGVLFHGPSETVSLYMDFTTYETNGITLSSLLPWHLATKKAMHCCTAPGLYYARFRPVFMRPYLCGGLVG